jgi:hypothetical protein
MITAVYEYRAPASGVDRRARTPPERYPVCKRSRATRLQRRNGHGEIFQIWAGSRFLTNCKDSMSCLYKRWVLRSHFGWAFDAFSVTSGLAFPGRHLQSRKCLPSPKAAHGGGFRHGSRDICGGASPDLQRLRRRDGRTQPSIFSQPGRRVSPTQYAAFQLHCQCRGGTRAVRVETACGPQRKPFSIVMDQPGRKAATTVRRP